MVLVLCGAGRDRQRSGEQVAVHHSAKTSWQQRKRTVGGSPSGGGAGTAEVIELCCKLLKLLWGKNGTKIRSCFSLHYILEPSYFFNEYFLSKGKKKY